MNDLLSRQNKAEVASCFQFQPNYSPFILNVGNTVTNKVKSESKEVKHWLGQPLFTILIKKSRLYFVLLFFAFFTLKHTFH